MDFYTNLTFKVQKGHGLGSRDPISKFWDPLITFERIELSASNLAQTKRTDPYFVRIIKRPQSIRHVGRNQYSVRYLVQEWGNYVLVVKWGDLHIPDSPFHVVVH